MSAIEALRLALPATACAVLSYAYRPLDQYFVQWLGQDAQAALGATTFVVILASSAFILLSAGAGPLVARATGAGDAAARRRAIGSGLFACAGMSVGLVVLGLLCSRSIVDLLGVDAAVARWADDYLRMLFLTGAALVFGPLVTSAFNGLGDTALPLGLQVGAVALNAALNPLLIYRLQLGTAGAALASTISQTLAVAIGLWVLWRRVGLSFSDVRPSPELRRIVAIGAPVGLSTALYALVYWGIFATSIARLGPGVASGLGIGFGALEAFTWPMYLGGSVAVASMIGRCLGAGRPDEAWRAVRMIWAPVVAIGVGFLLLFRFAGPTMVGWFASDPDAFREGVKYAAILALSQPFVALEAFGEGVLGGAGATRTLFAVTVPFNLIRVPLAYWLAIHLGWGAAGVWWAINLTTYGKGLFKVLAVAHGGWARLKI